MEVVGAFLAGFASGWVVRSTADSSRNVAVKAIAAAYAVVDDARRWVATEREYFEDLVAEGRARFEAARARKAAQNGTAPRDVATETSRAASDRARAANHAA